MFILKTFLLTDFECYEDHECSYTYVHAAMVGHVVLHIVDNDPLIMYVRMNIQPVTVLACSITDTCSLARTVSC